MNFINKEDIILLKYKKPPFTELGEFIYQRTYSRWIPELSRREQWLETCIRTVNYTMGIEYDYRKKHNMEIDMKAMQKEGGKLLDNMFNLRQFTSGRTMWVGGTEVADKFPMANFNCAFLVLTGDTFEAFGELFYLLMIGTGVGFRTLPEDVERLPSYRQNVEIIHKNYYPLRKNERHDLSEFEISDTTALIHIGDSKEGWVGALDIYFKMITSFLYNKVDTIIFDYDSVRPKGERLKTFGGTASGYESLRGMFIKISKALIKAEGKLRPIDVLDICNIIGENVVVGGVRRTAEINLSSKDEEEIDKAKTNLYTQDENGIWSLDKEISHRQMSNNSIFYEQKPTREELRNNFINMRYTGERGFVNAEKGRSIRSDFAGMNPCAEVLMADKGLCNLTTVNIMAFVHDGVLNKAELYVAFKLSARIGLRMTLVDLEIPAWDRQQKKDRLIGCSLTGWFDAIDSIKMSKADQKALRKTLKKIVDTEANGYAEELGINAPLLATTIKPEGTISKLPTVSEGLHRSHSPYYIRRVRINAHDPLVKVVEELGWDIKPENGQEMETASTLVVAFPCISPVKKTKGDVSAIEQLETYKEFMEDYVEHNASITVHVRENEWEETEQWVWDNWDSIVAICFLPYDDSVYQQAPYEEIDELEYWRRKTMMKPFDSSLLQKYEKEEEELDIGNDGCSSGSCPVR